MPEQTLALIAIACIFIGGMVWWFSVVIRETRHAKDSELQELQSQIDVLQIQIRELQIACKAMGGNGFTRTPN